MELETKRRVTDNARNIMYAGKFAGLHPHVGCFEHVINLTTQRWLKIGQMDRLLGRVRRILNFFHKSLTAMAVLKNKQTLLGLPNHKLIGDVFTRWNPSYGRLKCYFEQRIAIEATLMSKDVKKCKGNVHLVIGWQCFSWEDYTDPKTIENCYNLIVWRKITYNFLSPPP